MELELELEFQQLTGAKWTRSIREMRWSASRVIGENGEEVSNVNSIMSMGYRLHTQTPSQVYRLYGAILTNKEAMEQTLVATVSVHVDYAKPAWVLPTVAAVQTGGPSPLFPLLDYVVTQMESEGVHQLYGCIPKKYARAYDKRRRTQSTVYSRYASETVEELPPYCASYNHVLCAELTLGNVFAEPMLIRRYWRSSDDAQI